MEYNRSVSVLPRYLRKNLLKREFNQTKLIFKDGFKGYLYDIPFPSSVVDYDNKTYLVDVKCIVLPGIDEAINYLSVQIPFTHRDYDSFCKGDDWNDKDVCWNYIVYPLPKMKTSIPKKDQSEAIVQMKAGNILAFNFYAKTFVEGIQKETVAINKVKLIAEILEIIVNHKSVRINYEFKNENKARLLEMILNELSFIQIDYSVNPEEMILMGEYLGLIRFYMSNTADGFIKMNEFYASFFINSLTMSLKEQMSDVDKSIDWTDYYIINSAFWMNIKQWIPYFQITGLIDKEDETTGLITDKKVRLWRDELTSYLFNLLKRGYSLEYENMQFITQRIDDTQNEGELTLKKFNITITIPLKAIREKVGSKILGIGAIAFNDNPFISSKNKKLNRNNIRLHIFTEDGEIEWKDLNTQSQSIGDRYVVKFTIDPPTAKNTEKPYCYRYDEKNYDLVYDGIITEFVIGSDTIVKCYSDKLGEIFIGYLDKKGESREVKEIEDEDEDNSVWWKYFWAILLVIAFCAVIGFLVFRSLKKKGQEKLLAGEVNMAGFDQVEIN